MKKQYQSNKFAGEVVGAGASVGGRRAGAGKKEFPPSIAIDLVSGILQPVLSVPAAAGMTKGLLSPCAFFGWLTKDSGTYTCCVPLPTAWFTSCLSSGASPPHASSK